MQMSISSPWQGKNHLRSLGEHVKKQSLIISHPRKKGAVSTKLPRHKTLIHGTDEPRVLPLIFHLQNPDHLSVSLISTSQCTHLPHGSKKSKPDLVSTRPFMLELSHLQTHRPPTTSQPTSLASIPLRNTTRLRHLLPPHPSTPHLDTFNTHPTPNIPPTIHPIRTPRNSLQHRNPQPPPHRLTSRHNTHPLPILQHRHRPQPRNPKHSRHNPRNRRPPSSPTISLRQQGLSPDNSSKQEESLANRPPIRIG